MNKFSWILIIASSVLFLTACSNNTDDSAWVPDSPLKTTFLMNKYARDDNYEQFKTLLLEGNDEKSIKKMYDTVKQSATNSSKINNFTLVTFDNGKTVLVHFIPAASEDGDVLIQDVIELPAEMASYIDDELNKRFER